MIIVIKGIVNILLINVSIVDVIVVVMVIIGYRKHSWHFIAIVVSINVIKVIISFIVIFIVLL